MLTCSAPARQLPSIGVAEVGGEDPNPDGLHYFSKCTPVSFDLDNLAQPLQPHVPRHSGRTEVGQHSPGALLFYVKLNLTACVRAQGSGWSNLQSTLAVKPLLSSLRFWTTPFRGWIWPLIGFTGPEPLKTRLRTRIAYGRTGCILQNCSPRVPHRSSPPLGHLVRPGSPHMVDASPRPCALPRRVEAEDVCRRASAGGVLH